MITEEFFVINMNSLPQQLPSYLGSILSLQDPSQTVSPVLLKPEARSPPALPPSRQAPCMRAIACCLPGAPAGAMEEPGFQPGHERWNAAAPSAGSTTTPPHLLHILLLSESLSSGTSLGHRFLQAARYHSTSSVCQLELISIAFKLKCRFRSSHVCEGTTFLSPNCPVH